MNCPIVSQTDEYLLEGGCDTLSDTVMPMTDFALTLLHYSTSYLLYDSFQSMRWAIFFLSHKWPLCTQYMTDFRCIIAHQTILTVAKTLSHLLMSSPMAKPIQHKPKYMKFNT